MKVIISYPPINKEKGHATLGQNRQFQYFKEPTFIYPVVPAQAATLLSEAGHEVIWNDCIAEGAGYESFINFIKEKKADLIAFETKTPVVKQHWRIIDDIKSQFPNGSAPLIVLFGDH
ncbi:MAG: B12-binding domain-containing radical SAM protein, partial [Candidatus Omnitrophica bacterium]|nr:B12-binding domain-containing radical SAM protein [Candidatus Omnitrophota bacterium]